MNYYPHHIGDYLRDTAHLNATEDGIYRRMLDLYYASEKQLPLNIDGLCRLIRARSREEKNSVDTILAEFFQRTESGWRNKRAEEEISKSKEKSDLARASARMRWQSGRNAKAMRTHSEGNAPNNQEPITKNQRDRSTQRSQGSRLPAGWVPSELLKAWACKERPDLDLLTVVPKFRDYWAAVPGSRGTKLDWDATFRNFIRTERTGGKGAAPDYSSVIAGLKD